MTMDNLAVPRWLQTDDWPGLLEYHLDTSRHKGVVVDPPGSPRWTSGSELMRIARTEEIQTIPDSSLDAVWLEDTGAAMSGKLESWWRKLKAGGYLGGPSCGFGFTACGRWTIGTEAAVREFARNAEDCSEIFTGNQPNPCWFVFKGSRDEPRVLVMSGSDRSQYESFGFASERNHLTYAAAHGYDCCWLDWEDLYVESRHYSWAKIRAMIQKLECGRWDQVWWIDADAVFLDFGKRLAGYLHPSWTGVFPEFINGRVMASMGVWGGAPGQLAGLHEVWSRTDRGLGYSAEEWCLADSLYEKPELWKGLQLTDHRLFNAVPNWNILYGNSGDNFIVHFACCENASRKQFIESINSHLGMTCDRADSL